MKSIVEAVATLNERRLMMDFLDQLRDKSFTPDFDVKTFLGNVSQKQYVIISEIFEAAYMRGKDAFMGEIEKAQEELKSLPIVNLTIAIEPTEETGWMVKNWFKEEMGKDILVDFETDKTLIGGAIVESSGKRTELSFRQYFEKKAKN